MLDFVWVSPHKAGHWCISPSINRGGPPKDTSARCLCGCKATGGSLAIKPAALPTSYRSFREALELQLLSLTAHRGKTAGVTGIRRKPLGPGWSAPRSAA